MDWREQLRVQYFHLEHLARTLPLRNIHRWLSYQYQMGEIAFLLYGPRRP
jgi:hypothetical protein